MPIAKYISLAAASSAAGGRTSSKGPADGSQDRASPDGRQAGVLPDDRRSPERAREGARPPKHRTTAQGKATPAALRPKLRTAARGRKSVSLSQ